MKQAEIIDNQVATQEVSSARIYLEQALVYRKESQWPEAIRACEAALKLNPELAEAYKVLGDANQSLGEFSKAIGYYGKAIALKPDFPEAYANLGSLYAQQSKWQQALDYYQKALEIKPDLAGVYNHIAKVRKHLNPQANQVNAAAIYLEQALAYKEESQWSEVIRACETALGLDPKLAKAYKVLGDANQSLGKFSAAIGYYGQAITIKPDFPEAYANLGTLYAQQKQWQQALDYYQKALELKPDLAGVYKHVARVWQNLGQPEKAQSILAQAQKLESQSQTQTSPKDLFHLGEQACQQGNLEQALKYYQQAVQLAPNFSQAYQRLAAITEKMGLWQESTIYYRQLLQLKDSVGISSLPPARKQLSLKQQIAQNYGKKGEGSAFNAGRSPTESTLAADSADYQVSQGNLFAQKQQWREAILHYQKAIELNPKLVAAYRNLARILTQIGKIEQATSYWLKAVELDAQGLQAGEYLQLANNLVTQGKTSQAVTCYRRAIQLQPTLIDAYLNLGQVLTTAGELPKALQCYQEAIKYNPQNHQLYFNLGLCFTQQKNWEQAVQCYQQALQIKSDYWEALHNLGGVLGNLQLWSEAITVYRRAIKLKPDVAWSYNDLGLILLQVNRPEEAIAVFRKAVSLKPDFAAAHLRLGDALATVSKWSDAISAYQASGQIQADLPNLSSKLGNVFFQQSEEYRQTALRHFMQAIEQDPDNTNNYHQALAIDKNNIELYLRLGNRLIEQKNLDEAIVAYQMAVQLQPKNVEATIRLTNALMEKHPETDVKKLVERLISLPTSTLQQQEDNAHSLDISANITLPYSDHPVVSIIIPVYNKLDYTIQCLSSLANQIPQDIQVEVIVINDCSTDCTQEILEQVAGLKLINNSQNLGFIHSCNKGAEIAQGEYLYFLNNDTQIRPQAIESLVEVFQGDQTVGVVGSKLIYPDGSLQEAGGVIWQDASGWNYGRNENPFDSKYNYLREVDYCSGASLMVKQSTFNTLGGFATEFAPAYYEDTDLCFAIRHQLGLKVIYQPKSEVIHYEGISSGTSTASGVKQYQVVNAQKFQQKWRHFLSTSQYLPNQGSEGLPRAARKYQGQKTILVIDTYMPCYDKESGSQRLFHLLKIFRQLDYHVIFAADNGVKDEPYNEELQNLQIETLYTQDGFGNTPESQITERLPLIDLAWICRPDLNEKYLPLIRSQPNIKVVYDTIDLHYLRMKRAWELSTTKNPQETTEWVNMQKRELKIARKADLTITVTEVEKSILQQQGINSVEVVPNVHVPRTSQDTERDTSFAARKDILFIGSYNHPPNVDAVLWLCREIMPLVWEQLPSVKVTLLGSNPTAQVQSLASDRVAVTGYIRDVSDYFLSHRIFVSPLRYGAGMKGKIGQSLEYSLPIISTAVGIEGMHLTTEKNLLEANDTVTFAQAILRLYQTEELWSYLASNSQEAISIFTPETIKHNLHFLLEKLNNHD
ncbi:tetratricopeptide repeat protein [Xenococcus sp. PCC 7305]|uniref:tetratricopeptide repeat protein n=1 Tax=Xenococcus sp. PCC 7305 TaxID=102125 RepID=UPI0002EBB211|nr:tetratricopeptide repeat protein [Xenococcus sp. PCC 7305]